MDMRSKRRKASAEKLAAIIQEIQNGARPDEWPTFGMSEEEVIEHCRKTREKLWQEKLRRHAIRCAVPRAARGKMEENHAMMKRRKRKASPERIAELIRQIQESAPPEEWPTFGMTKEEVIEHCRKTRERLWEETMARHASRT